MTCTLSQIKKYKVRPRKRIIIKTVAQTAATTRDQSNMMLNEITNST